MNDDRHASAAGYERFVDIAVLRQHGLFLSRHWGDHQPVCPQLQEPLAAPDREIDAAGAGASVDPDAVAGGLPSDRHDGVLLGFAELVCLAEEAQDRHTVYTRVSKLPDKVGEALVVELPCARERRGRDREDAPQRFRPARRLLPCVSQSHSLRLPRSLRLSERA